jgi:RimJ/RimL family protein N-acetyltransferase
VGTLTATQQRRPRTAWLPTPRLARDGVVLRRLGSRDTDRIVEACTDPLLTRWLTTLPMPYSEADAHGWLEETRETAATGRGVTWAVAAPTDDRLLGVVTVFDIDPDANAEIGYWSHPEARGRGVMRRACALATRHAFVPHEDGGLGLRRLRALVADGNAASVRVVEATSFRETGRWRRAKLLRDGTRVDLVHFDLLAEEYRPPDEAAVP